MDVATGAIGSLLPQLEELITEDYKLHKRSRGDVRDLILYMRMMQADLVTEAELRPGKLDPEVHIWAEEVRQLSFNMDDVVAEFLRTPKGLKGLVEKMGSLFKKGKTPHQIITSAIKYNLTQVQYLHHKRDMYPIVGQMSNSSCPPGRREDLVGIVGKKEQELMKVLWDGDNTSNKKLKIVSVVGFGGLGKTSIVKAVYDKIKIGFDCIAFVRAGQNSDVEKLLNGIMIGLPHYENKPQNLDEQELIKTLQEMLHNKRYLIVIDDIWNEKLWQSIKYAFSNENNLGSRIITTTRIVRVSKACCSSANDSVYQMEPLSDDDSRKLLCDIISDSVSNCHQELEQVYSHILNKCGGVPLAIIAMASVLTGYLATETRDEWHVLLNSIGRGHEENREWEDMQRILSFSYYDLLPHLKTCLLYLSTFSVTHTIQKNRLAKKLTAEGIFTQKINLIGSSNEKEAKISQELCLEEAAREYLDELSDRNVIHPLKYNSNGEVISYHIHPMMHDVLKAKAMEENFAALLDSRDISRAQRMNFRYLFVDCTDSENPINASNMAFDDNVRSLTVFGHANEFLLRHFKGILVLDLEGCKSIDKAQLEYICSMILLKRLCLAKTDITELPPQIGNLKYLEGLDIGETQITKLPTNIGKLKHLKILDARKSRVKDLPNEVIRLTRLVHLLIGDNESCEGVKLPDGIGKMTSLQQLCTIDLSKCSLASLEDLRELPNLIEIAVVAGDEMKDTIMNDALLSSLHKSNNLRSVVVYSNFRLSTLQFSSAYKSLICRKKLTVVRRSLKVPIVIAGYHFLSMLDIRVCKVEEDDLKILRELLGLQSLILRLEVVPRTMVHISSEGFSKLESFHVDFPMPRVIFQEGAMPNLEDLGLQFYAGSAMEEHIGMKHLLNLQKVILRYSKWCATNKGVRETTDAVKTEAEEHQNEITLCIAEESKDGTCTMKTEIFQENRVASCSRFTEIEEEEEEEEEEDTQEGGLHQSSRATASCSGTSEIEEVVE